MSLQCLQKLKKYILFFCEFLAVPACSSLYSVKASGLHSFSFQISSNSSPVLISLVSLMLISEKRENSEENLSQAPTKSTTPSPEFVLICFGLFPYYNGWNACVLSKG